MASTAAVRRLIISRFGGLYNDLFGRRLHLGAGAVIFDQAGRVLLVRHSYGKRNWDLPGGGRHAGESMEQALRRELHEEIGVEIASLELRGVYFEPEMDQHHFAFLCRLAEEPEPKPGSVEILECGYWPVDALPRPMTDFTVRRIADAQGSTRPITITVLGPRRWLG
ncbi:MAG TPA: NUDIX domain-containing protein [Candidatus Dormibacteraeota bacterium]|nr:NUDIX domain-containing protein [Candidatus Dormibacteraeota bacterium]